MGHGPEGGGKVDIDASFNHLCGCQIERIPCPEPVTDALENPLAVRWTHAR